ncbi:MAG: MurR/RpiR family transcriptional regulator [Angelakisella sp.]
MNAENVVETINKTYSKLTKSEKRIANFVYSNPVEVQYMSITTFAEQCEVADATIFRFCKSLGLGGYNEFKLALAKATYQMEEEASSIAGRQEDFPVYGKVNPADSFSDMCQKLYSAEVSAISQTRQLLEEKDIQRAAELLHDARRVYCLGQGSSLILAMEAWSRFVGISPNFFCVEDSHLQAVTTSLLTDTDAILFFSYSGATKDMPDILRPAKARGTKIILVTHFVKSPAAYFADVVLPVGSNEGPHQQGSIAAKVAQLFAIDVLFNEFWRLDPETYRQNNEITSAATAAKLL